MMKKNILVLLLFSITVLTVKAQEQEKQTQAQQHIIHFERKSNKPFIVNNKAYTFKERKQIFKNEEALTLLAKANSKAIGAQILGGIGGGFLGASLADILLSTRKDYSQEQWNQKKKIRTVFLGAGAAFTLLSIPAMNSAVNKTKEAVQVENASLTAQPKLENSLKFEVGVGSVKLAYRF